MEVNKTRFEIAKIEVLSEERQRTSIGTYSEKSVHRILKRYFEPDVGKHEVRVSGMVADVYTGSEIFEIQSTSFGNIGKKLERFDPIPTTVVYPAVRQKYLSWIDPATGTVQSRHKSPKTGKVTDILPEMVYMLDVLRTRKVSFIVALMDVEEFRLRDGWGNDGKRGSHRYDRVPTELVSLTELSDAASFASVLPDALKTGNFTVKDAAKALGMSAKVAARAVTVLCVLGSIERVGKRKNAYLYQIADFSV